MSEPEQVENEIVSNESELLNFLTGERAHHTVVQIVGRKFKWSVSLIATLTHFGNVQAVNFTDRISLLQLLCIC